MVLIREMTDIVSDLPKPDFGATLSKWLVAAQDLVTKDHVRQFPNSREQPTLIIDPKGKKYVRIVRKTHPDNDSGSVFCFIDKQTGDILKAASWSAPAKGPRGNIYAANPIAGITPYGAEYRR